MVVTLDVFSCPISWLKARRYIIIVMHTKGRTNRQVLARITIAGNMFTINAVTAKLINACVFLDKMNQSLCTVRSRKQSPVLEFQILAVPSSEVVSTDAPLGKNTADVNESVCQANVKWQETLTRLFNGCVFLAKNGACRRLSETRQ